MGADHLIDAGLSLILTEHLGRICSLRVRATLFTLSLVAVGIAWSQVLVWWIAADHSDEQPGIGPLTYHVSRGQEKEVLNGGLISVAVSDTLTPLRVRILGMSQGQVFSVEAYLRRPSQISDRHDKYDYLDGRFASSSAKSITDLLFEERGWNMAGAPDRLVAALLVCGKAGCETVDRAFIDLKVLPTSPDSHSSTSLHPGTQRTTR